MEENLNPEEENKAGMEQAQEKATEQPVSEPTPISKEAQDVQYIAGKIAEVKAELNKVLVGQSELVDLLLISLLSGGHALIEGVPGIAKTLTANLLSKCLSVDFSRIQFTPDLMPADVVGTNVFNMKNSEFEFKPGPLFGNVILIDEINRAPAKTQSALFEVMEEYQITIDGKTYPLDQPYLVIATQNPIEQEGTYKLPEAQLDRFLFRIIITYPGFEDEVNILQRFKQDFNMKTKEDVKAVLSPSDLKKMKETVENIKIEDSVLEYIAKLTTQTRQHPDLYLGASPRASINLLKSAKANAALSGRTFVTPDDVKKVLHPVMNHRLILSPEREMEGYDINDVLEEIIKDIEVPR
ncbi:MAG: MoxR family ATPase [Schleiferiaceae bacterium]|jgi:MoxR-like ATPase|nr:MoxR family ATPase [Schleiferiaceae bacterium]